MKFEEIKELINIIDNSKLAYFEANIENQYIKMDKSMSRNSANNLNTNEKTEEVQISQNPTINKVENLEEAITSEASKIDAKFEYIKSPMVGTFYKAMSPDADSFVSVGQKVSKGDIVCIVEAMKLMNEISADSNLEILEVMVNDKDMVEYGQELFKIRRY